MGYTVTWVCLMTRSVHGLYSNGVCLMTRSVHGLYSNMGVPYDYECPWVIQ